MKKTEWEDIYAEVSKVYCELTNNKLSKPEYKATVILDEVRLQQQQEIEDAINNHNQQIIKLIDEMGNFYALRPSNTHFDQNSDMAKIECLSELKQKIESL